MPETQEDNFSNFGSLAPSSERLVYEDLGECGLDRKAFLSYFPLLLKFPRGDYNLLLICLV